MKKCPTCGNENPEGSRTCFNCQTMLVNVPSVKVEGRKKVRIFSLSQVLILCAVGVVLYVLSFDGPCGLNRVQYVYNHLSGIVDQWKAADLVANKSALQISTRPSSILDESVTDLGSMKFSVQIIEYPKCLDPEIDVIKAAMTSKIGQYSGFAAGNIPSISSSIMKKSSLDIDSAMSEIYNCMEKVPFCGNFSIGTYFMELKDIILAKL